MPKDKKTQKKANPDMLGTGMANKAAKAIKNRRAQIDAQINGTYERKDQRDTKPNKKK